MTSWGLACAYAEDPKAPAAAPAKELKAQTMCPVMNKAIDKNRFVDFEGKRIYVCCSFCIKAVKKDPAKYVKMLEDQGITLEKATAPAEGEKAAEPVAPKAEAK